MEKSAADKDSTSCGVCEKVYNAVASAFRATNRKSSNRSQAHVVVAANITVPKQPLKGPAAKTTAPHIIVQEEKPKPAKLTISKNMSRKTDPGQDKKEGDKFSDYITQFKDKMRTQSDVGEMAERLSTNRNRVATRRDSFNDKVARYINRARVNIRTTTSNAFRYNKLSSSLIFS